MRAEDVGLTAAEYQKILSLMNRAPNDVELGLFGALWSEHCSYKSTKDLLARLPHEGPQVIQGPGENAGVVAVADDLEIAFKVESHNHPSYVEPVQGAATGVGGILRDIIAMGARPIAVADMLRFGSDPASQRIARGVVKGVGQYGNAIGIPTVTGDVAYSDTYRANPLVNVMAVGLRTAAMRISASTAQAGNVLVLAGQRTGRDGIHGASLLASRDFSADSSDLRPTVQVGDPFVGKLLMEATLQSVEKRLLAALQDLGAAGLTSALAELCVVSGVGAEIWLDQVPLREPSLSAYEIMLSETQERMLLAVPRAKLDEVLALYRHFEIPATEFGLVTDTGCLRLHHGSRVVGDLDARWLVKEAPRKEVDETWWNGLDAQPDGVPDDGAPSFSGDLLLTVVGNPTVRDRSAIYRQYDAMIQTRTVWGPDHDQALLWLKPAPVGLVIAVSGTGRWAAVDAYAGGAGAVWHALAQLAAQGAEFLGITDGVNAGNPDIAENFRAMAALLRGVADVARAAGVPVTGGNVSLHNETDGQAIWPTVMIGAVGRHHDPLHPLPDHLGAVGDEVCLITPHRHPALGGTIATGRGSYQRIDVAHGARLLTKIQELAREHRVESLRTVGAGGTAAALVRMMAASPTASGVALSLTATGVDRTRRLFSEGPLEWTCVVKPGEVPVLAAALQSVDALAVPLGRVTDNGQLTVDGRHRWSRGQLLEVWRGSQEEAGV